MLTNLIYMLGDILTKSNKRAILLLVIFTFFISVIEVVGISSIMPFLAVAIDFDVIQSNKYYNFAYNLFNFKTSTDFVITFGLVLIIFYGFRFAINILYIYISARFARGLHHSIVNKLFAKYFHSSYIEFSQKNSANLNKTLITESEYLMRAISSLLSIFSESLIIILLYIFMFYVNYKLTIALSIFLMFSGYIMFVFVTKKIKVQGVKREKAQKIFYEIANKSFANFKILKLYENNINIKDDFFNASKNYSSANIVNMTLSAVPRFFLESIGFGMIIAMIVYLIYKNPNNISYALPIISVFVLSLYRILPSINRIIGAMNSIVFSHKSLTIIHQDLKIKVEKLGNDSITFSNSIKLDNITFSYNKNKDILNNISLKINKGEKIAFVGESGSGKSTLVDLIAGLYKPNVGKILIDNVELNYNNKKQWREKIGYIPQNIYLFDGTVGENIAIGAKFDKQKIDYCLKIANIYDFLQTKEGMDTFVGEGGIRLSGGQKQRIAIARALYHNPEILILDEATSALDTKIEAKIMQEIYKISQDKTLIIIAHRLSTIDKCDTIYKIEDNKLTKTNSA